MKMVHSMHATHRLAEVSLHSAKAHVVKGACSTGYSQAVTYPSTKPARPGVFSVVWPQATHPNAAGLLYRGLGDVVA